MRVRIPGMNNKISKVDRKFIKQSIAEDLEKERKAEREVTTRRLLKLVCYILHERYGFGQKRCSDVLLDIIDLINQGLEHWDGDVGDFWYKIDEELKRYNLNFYPSEDDILREKLMENSDKLYAKINSLESEVEN